MSIKVMNDQGMAKTSDVIKACSGCSTTRASTTSVSANFSLHAGYSTNFYRDPLDRAVEDLVQQRRRSGSRVPLAAGPSGVLFAPGNDPFVITVGAVDLGTSPRAYDDSVAPVSAYGYTKDGFYKPDVSAPGRYVVHDPAGSTITSLKPDVNRHRPDPALRHVCSAPIVAGAAPRACWRGVRWTPSGEGRADAHGARRPGSAKAAGLGEIAATRGRDVEPDTEPEQGTGALRLGRSPRAHLCSTR